MKMSFAYFSVFKSLFLIFGCCVFVFQSTRRLFTRPLTKMQPQTAKKVRQDSLAITSLLFVTAEKFFLALWFTAQFNPFCFLCVSRMAISVTCFAFKRSQWEWPWQVCRPHQNIKIVFNWRRYPTIMFLIKKMDILI